MLPESQETRQIQPPFISHVPANGAEQAAECPKETFHKLCHGEIKLTREKVFACLDDLIGQELISDGKMQNILVLLFRELLSDELNAGQDPGGASLREVLVYLPEEIHPFLEYAKHLEAKRKQDLREFVEGYISDALTYCKAEDLDALVTFCRELCKAFGFGQANIIKDKSERHGISDALKRRYSAEALKKAKKSLTSLGITLNPQKGRGKGGGRPRSSQDAQIADNIARLTTRIESPSAGGGRWVTG